MALLWFTILQTLISKAMNLNSTAIFYISDQEKALPSNKLMMQMSTNVEKSAREFCVINEIECTTCPCNLLEWPNNCALKLRCHNTRDHIVIKWMLKSQVCDSPLLRTYVDQTMELKTRSTGTDCAWRHNRQDCLRRIYVLTNSQSTSTQK